MNFKSRCFPISLVGLLVSLSLFLTACGSERIAQFSRKGETGEFYSADRTFDSEIQNVLPSGSHNDPVSGIKGNSSSDGHMPVQSDFAAFCDQVFLEEMSGASTLDLHYTLLHPENYGIETGDVTLGTVDLADMIHCNEEVRDLKARLEQFDRAALSNEQRLLYDTLSETLNTSLMREGMELYEQPLAPTIGVQAQLPILLAEYTFHSAKDVEDYLALLTQIDTYYDQILTFENQKAAAGLAPSDISIDKILESCESYRIAPEDNFLTETFETRLSALSEKTALSEEQKTDFRNRHTAAIRDHFIPAYENLIAGMAALKGKGFQDGGLCGLKDGKKYYEYLLKSGPGLSYSVAELKQALSAQMEDDLSAISRLYAENPNLDVNKGTFELSDPQQILDDLKQKMAVDFPALPNCGYEVRYVPKYLETSLSPAFYLTAPIDDVNQNVIYINNGYSDSTDSLYTTLAHEGFPGHLYQTVYNRTHAANPLASILSCSGANEGWATYVENYACTFDNGLPEGIGEYRAHLRSFSLCVHGLLDIGINYDGWTKEQAKEFIQNYFQADDETVSELWQVMIDNPVNYLEYCGGYVEFMEMRKEAEKVLGNRFSPMEFHKFILDVGPVPFSVMRAYFSQWLGEKAV